MFARQGHTAAIERGEHGTNARPRIETLSNAIDLPDAAGDQRME